MHFFTSPSHNNVDQITKTLISKLDNMESADILKVILTAFEINSIEVASTSTAPRQLPNSTGALTIERRKYFELMGDSAPVMDNTKESFLDETGVIKSNIKKYFAKNLSNFEESLPSYLSKQDRQSILQIAQSTPFRLEQCIKILKNAEDNHQAQLIAQDLTSKLNKPTTSIDDILTIRNQNDSDSDSDSDSDADADADADENDKKSNELFYKFMKLRHMNNETVTTLSEDERKILIDALNKQMRNPAQFINKKLSILNRISREKCDTEKEYPLLATLSRSHEALECYENARKLKKDVENSAKKILIDILKDENNWKIAKSYYESGTSSYLKSFFDAAPLSSANERIIRKMISSYCSIDPAPITLDECKRLGSDIIKALSKSSPAQESSGQDNALLKKI